MDRIGVFGPTGFIGSHFIAANPGECVAVPRSELSQSCDEVLYTISTTHNYHVFDEPYLDIETNLTRLIQTLEANKGTVRVFNFLSSWFVYGEPFAQAEPERGRGDREPALSPRPRRETDPCNPTGFYSITKLCAEQMLACWCKAHGMSYRILRLANVIGPGDKGASLKKNALTHMIAELAHDRPIKLYGDGMFTRDYIHVHDACRAIGLIMEEGELDAVYNIGSGVPSVFSELIEYVRSRTASKSTIEQVEPPAHHKNVQVKSFAMDISKLRALGFRCERSARDAIDDTLGHSSH